MWNKGSTELSRNRGYLTGAEQDAICSATYAIGGAGGEGAPVALHIARSGGQIFRLADPDVIEPSNINRVPTAFEDTMGRNKAEVLAAEILRINPAADVSVFPDGITADNADSFVDDADVVFDGIDLSASNACSALHKAARCTGKAVVTSMNIGFGGVVTSFVPDGVSIESYLGGEEDRAGMNLSSVPCLPHYAHIDAFRAVQNGASLPSTEIGTQLTTAIAANQMILYAMGDRRGRPRPVTAPRYIHVDAMTGKSEIIKRPKARFYRDLGIIALRSLLGTNPKVEYT